MAAIESFSHLTVASVPAEVWDETWFLLQSWKGYLQSFPGLMATRISACPADGGDVRLYVWTVWKYPEELEEWRESEFSINQLLSHVLPNVYDVHEETLEDFS